ncbi:hypothetical protein PCANB_001328 [Pneumocystis canis]|nr:hypothetical protein PCANB_001328 [Pneumocystis canis]
MVSNTLELLGLLTTVLQRILSSIHSNCFLNNSGTCDSTPNKPNVPSNIGNNNTFVYFYPNSTIIKQPNITITINNTSSDNKITLESNKTIPIKNSSTISDIHMPIDVLKPISTQPPSSIFERLYHPLHPLSIHHNDLGKPIQTNKFYANLFLGSQEFPAYLDPYVLTWKPKKYSGITVSHVDDSQKVFADGDPPRFFLNPLGIYSFVFSAEELSNGKLTLTLLEQMSVRAIVSPHFSKSRKMELPLVRGMAYITAIYTELTPLFTSVVGFQKIEKIEIEDNKYHKYIITLYDGKHWLLYAFPEKGALFDLQIQDGMLKTVTGIFNGIIQVTKIPIDNYAAQNILDASAGTYAEGISLSAYVNGKTGSYTFTFNVSTYDSRPLLHYSLYHQWTSFDSDTSSRRTNVSLPSTTNGLMVAYYGDRWNMIESNLPIDIDFFPYSYGKHAEYSEEALLAIKKAVEFEVHQDIKHQIDENSIYFSGKIFSKIALLCFVANNILKDENLTKICLKNFKDSFMPFAKNQIKYKLVYESTWKGIVSSQGFERGPYVDFGSTYYNDHHFHYGYLIFAASVVGYIEPQWLEGIKDWVIDLIRDVSNPVNDDYYPAFRFFDWFSGHSWAKGIFESPDGKDEESSSEDYNFYFSTKLFGMVIKDKHIVSRANLMLAVMKRSFHSYFLYEQTNTVIPKVFLPNYVAGIKFSNKIDHTTYFSTRLECIQGIHMLPITPISFYIRTPSFVKSEWEALLASIVDSIDDGWKGILYANLAIYDPKRSYDFFSKDFDRKFLDGGSSLAWYLAYSSAFVNSES